jgi:hypothetical protein
MSDCRFVILFGHSISWVSYLCYLARVTTVFPMGCFFLFRLLGVFTFNLPIGYPKPSNARASPAGHWWIGVYLGAMID